MRPVSSRALIVVAFSALMAGCGGGDDGAASDGPAHAITAPTLDPRGAAARPTDRAVRGAQPPAGQILRSVEVAAAPSAGPVATVTVSPASSTVEQGGTRQLTATLRDAGGKVLSNRIVTWVSSTPATATVSTSGLVTGVQAGSVTITATSEGKSGSATVVVSAAVASVVVSPVSTSVVIGTSQRLQAIARDAQGNVITGRDVSWRSDRKNIATVTNDGLVAGVRIGTAQITASIGSVSGDADVAVVPPPPPPVATVSVSLGLSALFVGQSTQASAVTRDAAGNLLTGRTVTWSSSDASVATISAAGLVTALAPGTVQIRATSEGIVGSATLVVSPPPPPGSYTPLVSDAFTQYTSVAQLLANTGSGKPYCGFVSSSRIALDPSVTYAGHQTVRVDQPAGSNGIAQMTTCFASQSFWFRIKLRFSPGWTTTGSITNSANSFKMFGWWWAEGNGRGDLEITNTNQYQLHFDPQFSGKPFISVNAGTVGTEWSDGGWYDYVIHYEVSGTTTRTRWWFARDAETPVLRATANGIPAATAQGIGFPFFFNQTLRAAQSLWVGQWEVVDGVRFPSPWGL